MTLVEGRSHREHRNAGLPQLLQPWVDDREGAKRLDHCIGLLGHERLQLADQRLVAAPRIEPDGRAAELLHGFDLRLIGLEVEEVIGARDADRDRLALEGELGVVGHCRLGFVGHGQPTEGAGRA